MSQTGRVTDVIAERLAAAGCRYAFGIPGGETLTLLDALKNAGLEFILSKHENSGGFIGEGVHHVDGAPVVLVATIGPGVANAVNVVANAEQDRVPMVFLTGCVDAYDQLTYTHQVFDHGALLAPITKAQFVADADGIDVMIDKALAIATADPPGPVHIDIPVSVAAQAAKRRQQRPRIAPPRRAPAPGPQLDEARGWLAEAKRPIAVVGVDALYQRGEDAVADFLERRQIPLITSYKAKGVLPEDHPLALGGAGLSPQADQRLLPLLADSDLILLIGYDPIEMRPGWRNPWPADARVIELCALPNRHDMHQASVTFVGDVAAGLAALENGNDTGTVPQPAWDANALDAIRAELRDVYCVDEDWGPAAVVDVVRARLPRDAVVTVDSGAHRILTSQVWQSYLPRGILQSTALCTMGCALPLAAGVKLAAPQRAVVAFSGDAGMEMVLGELATLRDLKLAAIVVVFVDESLALIELKQRGLQLSNVGVDFGGTNFAAVADALGGRGYAVDGRDALAAALDEAQQSDTFSLIACRIQHPAYDGRI